MSDLRDRPLAILISDIHLSETAPRCRASEPDWMEAQARPLREIAAVQKKHGVPVFCAGDIFHRWDAPAPLINFALDTLPPMVSIYGNHDLPYHDPKQLERSAYATLFKARKISVLPADGFELHAGGVVAYGVPFGREIPKPDDRCGMIRLAVVHAYIWHELLPDTSYPGAPAEATVGAFKKKLKGYDVALFGDNHSPFVAKAGQCIVYNHGNLVRRTVDECRRVPEYGILYGDGRVERKQLESAAEDKFEIDLPEDATVEEDAEAIEEFVRNINASGEARFDYRQALDRYVAEHRVSKAVRTVLRRAIEKREKG